MTMDDQPLPVHQVTLQKLTNHDMYLRHWHLGFHIWVDPLLGYWGIGGGGGGIHTESSWGFLAHHYQLETKFSFSSAAYENQHLYVVLLYEDKFAYMYIG